MCASSLFVSLPYHNIMIVQYLQQTKRHSTKCLRLRHGTDPLRPPISPLANGVTPLTNYTKHGFLCPLAREFDCKKTFSSDKYAKIHANLHAGKKFLCPLAKEFDCKITFTSSAGAKAHSKGHTSSKICTVPMCAPAVAGVPFTTSASMAKHMKLHRVRGDLEALKTYPNPIKVQPNSKHQIPQPKTKWPTITSICNCYSRVRKCKTSTNR
jgi:hypothetical protein